MNPSQSNTGVDRSPPILIWIGGFAPIGGIETFTTDLSVAAVKAGREVDVLAWDHRSELLPCMRRAGVNVFCSPWRWGCQWFLPDWILFPLGLWKSRKASVVVFTKLVSHRMHRLFQRFGRSNGQRFVYVTPYRPAEVWPPEHVRDPAYRKEVEELLSGFDLIVCQNEIFARDLRELGYRGSLEMLPNLPPGRAQDPVPYPSEGPLTLGFLGRLEQQKNLPEMLKVFSLLLAEARQLPGAPRPLRLSLFGDGSLRAELEARARELGIAASVDFHGSIPRSRIREAIQSCQLFLFTSHSEGQPIASLEILAEGRPIIATAVGAFPDMLHTPALGEVVPVEDTQAFIATVKKMLARQAAGEVSPRDTVAAYEARFDRERTLRRYIELISVESAEPELCAHPPETGSAI